MHLFPTSAHLTILRAIQDGFPQRHHKEQPDFPSSALSEAGTTITTYSRTNLLPDPLSLVQALCCR